VVELVVVIEHEMPVVEQIELHEKIEKFIFQNIKMDKKQENSKTLVVKID
jgi:hypothetical protein